MEDDDGAFEHVGTEPGHTWSRCRFVRFDCDEARETTVTLSQ